MTTIYGTLRADRRTKALTKRLHPGDIAVIHHPDLDATAARALVDCRVAAVVNAVQSITGRYPNQGPTVLLDSGIPLLDHIGDTFFEYAIGQEGTRCQIESNVVHLADGFCGHATLMTRELIAAGQEEGRANLDHELDAFARNTLEFLASEKELLLDPVALPQIRTHINGRHVLVVVRGEGYQDDLAAIEPYLRDVRPVLIGVDGGADALLAVGLRPDIIMGDMDSVSDTALRCGAELVVHAYAKGNRAAPGLARVEELGLKAHVYHAPGTSEDIAMLVAYEKGASLIVAVGTHFSLVDFLDKGRGGMASTFLIRLRVGSRLVDAKGIGRLWAERRKPITGEILLLVAAALFPIGFIAYHSPFLRTAFNTARLTLRSTFGLH